MSPSHGVKFWPENPCGRDSGRMPDGGKMVRKTRRAFLAQASIGVAAGVAGIAPLATGTANHIEDPGQQQPAGAPPAFGTGPAVGPEVTPGTFAEAEKLVQIQLNEEERKQAASSWRGNMASLYERRTGPRKIALETNLSPFSLYRSVLPGQPVSPEKINSSARKSTPALCLRTKQTSPTLR